MAEEKTFAEAYNEWKEKHNIKPINSNLDNIQTMTDALNANAWSASMDFFKSYNEGQIEYGIDVGELNSEKPLEAIKNKITKYFKGIDINKRLTNLFVYEGHTKDCLMKELQQYYENGEYRPDNKNRVVLDLSNVKNQEELKQLVESSNVECSLEQGFLKGVGFINVRTITIKNK